MAYSILHIEGGLEVRGGFVEGSNDLADVEGWNGHLLLKQGEIGVAEAWVIQKFDQTLKKEEG